ncbi:Uncharacterised protein [Mycobacterium tuberculosis]|nr:Uncharacterised protein [Mycobacterium tuberculosis]
MVCTPARSSPSMSSSDVKLAKTFLFETMTPAGVRVDPEVYCKYAVSGVSLPVGRAPGLRERCRESKSSKSSSTIDGADWPGCG